MNLSDSLRSLGIESIWQPTGADPQAGYLLIVLHGRGDSAEGFTWLQQELALPNLSALLLNAPDPYYTGFSWYGLPPDQLPGILRSRELLAQVMNEVHHLGFPPERCILFGFSQGCLMTLEFGARYPKRLAAYIGISGYCFEPDTLLKEAAPQTLAGEWLITHGTQDDLLPVERTRLQMQQLIQGGLHLDYREYPKTHTIDLKVELPMIRAWLLTLISREPSSKPQDL